jgi:hypothetical protein
MRDNMSLGIWCFAILIAFLLFLVVPWLLKHPDALHAHNRSAQSKRQTAAPRLLHGWHAAPHERFVVPDEPSWSRLGLFDTPHRG